MSLDVRYNFKPNLYVTARGTYSTSRGTSDVFVSPESNSFASAPLEQKGSYQLGNLGTDNWSGKIVGNWIHNFDKQGTMFTLNLGWEVKRNKTTSSYPSTGSGFLFRRYGRSVMCHHLFNISEAPLAGEDLSTSIGGFAAANFITENRYVVDGNYRPVRLLEVRRRQAHSTPFTVSRSPAITSTTRASSAISDSLISFACAGSHGYTGSVKFDSYQAISTYTTSYSVNYLHYAGVGAIPMGMANPDLYMADNQSSTWV